MNLAELLTIPAEMFPDQEILRFEGASLDYGTLRARAARTAAALSAAGVGPGGRVALIETNSPHGVEVLFATTALGAAFVPINFRARGDELAGLVSAASPDVLLTGRRYAADVAELHAAPTVLTLDDLAAGEGLDGVADVDDGELAVLMFTSGTSGTPKAVMLSHGALTGYVLSTTEPTDGTPRGSGLLAVPLHHIAGLTSVLAAIFSGRRLVIMRQFDAGQWLALVEAERVTNAFLVPTMLKRVLDHPAFGETDLSSLELLGYGAAPMPPTVIRRAIEALPPAVQFVNAFGQTETTSTVTMLGPEDHRLDGPPEEVERRLRRLSSIGRPLADVELEVVDDEGRPRPRGEVGEIVVRSARVMAGYDGRAAETNETLRGGWLWTRDLGYVDEDGYIFLTGRRSDLIIRGGENISPAEVEAVLETHETVAEAAVVGVPDEEWGERVVAAVVAEPGRACSEEALIDYCRGRLAGFKRPERIAQVDELPRNALGKLIRSEVRRVLAEEGGET
ncbi:MAG TPA: AMP-binding protein [Gaiellaceae bacterium]|nr:AMP-binding protein [Gaiellaceae bacterium]